jgi:hypothetical protein
VTAVFNKDGVSFVWPAIIAVGHGNEELRRSALRLLARALPGGLPAVSKALAPAISKYEALIGGSFANNPAHAVMLALTRGLEDAGTREAALECAQKCADAAGDRERPFYLLPAVVFQKSDRHADDDTKEGIFRGFADRSQEDRTAVISYLVEWFGDRHCAHSAESIADCLIIAAQEYGGDFGPVQMVVKAKCWRMLKNEVREGVVRKLSHLCGIALAPGSPSVSARTPERGGNVPDDVVNGLLLEMIDGLAGLGK